MLTVMEAIQQRRSIRNFQSTPVPDEVIHQMLEAARLAPSGSNRQPWRFLVARGAAEKARLAQICLEQKFIEQAPVVFVCCADLTAYSKVARRRRYQELETSGVVETFSGRFADPTYRASLVTGPDPDLMTYLTSAVANTFIAIENMVLTATALGLGTCWVWALDEGPKIGSFFGLPMTTVVVAVLPTGYPAKVPPPRPRVPLSEILVRPVQ